MSNIEEQRGTFFSHAKSKFSNMQEDWILSGRTEEDFIEWFDKAYDDMDVYEVVAHVLCEPIGRIPNKELFLGPIYKTHKELACCDFATSLHNHIAFKQKT